MKKIVLAFLFFSVPLFAQQAGEKHFFKEFNWTIQIPEGFEKVDPKEWEKQREKGLDMVEEVYEAKLDSVLVVSKTILILKKGQFNHIEVCRQPFDPAIDGDYAEVNKEVAEILYNTFKEQMPGSTIDMKTGSENIGGKNFLKNDYVVTFPNGMTFYAHMYSRLFGKKELAVNIMYVDKKVGNALLDAFKTSVFE